MYGNYKRYLSYSCFSKSYNVRVININGIYLVSLSHICTLLNGKLNLSVVRKKSQALELFISYEETHNLTYYAMLWVYFANIRLNKYNDLYHNDKRIFLQNINLMPHELPSWNIINE